VLVLGIVMVLYASSLAFDYGTLFRRDNPLLAVDVARLESGPVARLEHARSVDELRSALARARAEGLKVSMAGSRHSQGGHTWTKDGVRLDMRSFNRILQIDTVGRRITVESGATWAEIQRALAPAGLAVKVMQSSNIFTVGGTLSANAHGRDLDISQAVEVVQRFSLMLADGSVVEVSRTEHPELFGLVIGGYGMYGIILDVTLTVAPDELYEQRSVAMDYTEVPGYFDRVIRPDSGIVLLLMRPSIDPRPDRFLREVVVVTWRRAAPGSSGSFALTEEEHVLRDRFFLGLSRKFDWAKSLRWSLQKKVELGAGESRIVSRNNAMRPPLAPLELLDYHSKRDTDIIQEYYIPMDGFVPFMDRLREILLRHDANVLSSTVRYVAANGTPVLAYAPERDVFAIIQMSNVPLSREGQAKAEAVTLELVDAAIKEGGTYYLTYQLYPTADQLARAYPRAREAFAAKRRYDPGELFSSRFYERYRAEMAETAEVGP
jgi:FAD/FMN-containing dehydrogenase